MPRRRSLIGESRTSATARGRNGTCLTRIPGMAAVSMPSDGTEQHLWFSIRYKGMDMVGRCSGDEPMKIWVKGPATSLHRKNTGDSSRSHDHRKAIPKLTSIGSTYGAPRPNLRAPLRVQETASIGQRPIESRQEKVESGKIRDLEIV